MIVKITPKDWGDHPQPIYTTFNTYVGQMGLEYVIDTIYTVIDKQLFFLSVIKHGMSFEVVKE